MCSRHSLPWKSARAAARRASQLFPLGLAADHRQAAPRWLHEAQERERVAAERVQSFRKQISAIRELEKQAATVSSDIKVVRAFLREAKSAGPAAQKEIEAFRSRVNSGRDVGSSVGTPAEIMARCRGLSGDARRLIANWQNGPATVPVRFRRRPDTRCLWAFGVLSSGSPRTTHPRSGRQRPDRGGAEDLLLCIGRQIP